MGVGVFVAGVRCHRGEIEFINFASERLKLSGVRPLRHILSPVHYVAPDAGVYVASASSADSLSRCQDDAL